MSENPDALAPREEENDPHYEPVIKLTEQVEVKTNEEDEDVVFKMRAKLFRFESASNEWKERGTGDVRLLQDKGTKKTRLVMRRDKTLKVCANHLVSAEMKLQPNIGSDRSWVWKVAADYSEEPPTSETLAIRFANSDNAGLFKEAFEKAQADNKKLTSTEEEKKEEEPTADAAEEKKEEPEAAAAEPEKEKEAEAAEPEKKD